MESAWILHLRLEPSSTAASGSAVGCATIQGALTVGSIQDAAAFDTITVISTPTGAVVF